MFFATGENPAGVTLDLAERPRKALLAKRDFEMPWHFGDELLLLEPTVRGRPSVGGRVAPGCFRSHSRASPT